MQRGANVVSPEAMLAPAPAPTPVSATTQAQPPLPPQFVPAPQTIPPAPMYIAPAPVKEHKEAAAMPDSTVTTDGTMTTTTTSGGNMYGKGWGFGFDPSYAHLTEHIDRSKDYLSSQATANEQAVTGTVDRAKDYLSAQATANDQAIQADIARGAVQNAQGFGAGIAANQATASALSDKISADTEKTLSATSLVGDKVFGGVVETLKSSAHLREQFATDFGWMKDKISNDFEKTAKYFYEMASKVDAGNSATLQTVVGGFKDNLRDNAVNTANIQLAVVSGFKDALVDSTKNQAATQLALATNTAAMQLAAAQNAAAAALAAATNTAALQASIAECCCENKALTLAEAGRTRDLINSLQAQNDARRIVELNDRVNYLLSKVPSGTPI